MKKIILSLIVLFTANFALAQQQTLDFKCSNLDGSSSVDISVGSGLDGFPLQSFKVDGQEKVDNVVQYVFQITQNNQLNNLVYLVETTQKTQLHTQAGLQATENGLVLNYVVLDMGVAEDEDPVVKQETYACTAPQAPSQTSPQSN